MTEREKVQCPICKGKGEVPGGCSHYDTMVSCYPCRGTGLIDKPLRFTKGQTIVIKSKAIYGWRTWVTVERDDPEHKQVLVKEVVPAVKYEDIEEED